MALAAFGVKPGVAIPKLGPQPEHPKPVIEISTPGIS
jgi:hypothetical protein